MLPAVAARAAAAATGSYDNRRRGRGGGLALDSLDSVDLPTDSRGLASLGNSTATHVGDGDGGPCEVITLVTVGGENDAP